MTNARSLANFATGIGTEGAVLTVDNTNNRIGIATTNPQNDLQVGLGITMEGDTGQVTFVGIVTAEGFRNSDGSVVGAASTDNIITGTAATFTSDVNIADSIIHVGDTDTKIRFPAADTFTVETAGAEALRIDSNGRVGIGTDTISSLLQIRTASAGANMFMLEADLGTNNNRSLSVTSPAIDSTTDPFVVNTGNSLELKVDSTLGLRIHQDASVGIGTNNPGGLLTVYGDPAEVRLQHDGNGSYSRLISDSNNQLNIYTGGGPNLAMVIDQNQNIGIGTTAITEKLTLISNNDASAVDNGLSIYRSVSDDKVTINCQGGAARFIADGGSGYIPFRFARYNGTTLVEDLNIASDGQVSMSNGILNLGTADSSSAHINSFELMTFNIDTDNDDTNRYFAWYHNGSNGGGTELARLTNDGDFNITGVGTATQWDATSDIALKENIEVIDEPITKLSGLKGVTFDWKKGGHSVGVIAQDVEKVLPTAVGGSKDHKTVNYNAIIGLLVESVKDQQKQIEELKSLLDK